MKKYFVYGVAIFGMSLLLTSSVQAATIAASFDTGLTKMFQAVKSVNTFSYAISARGDAVSGTDSGKVSFGGTGQLDITTLTAPKAQSSIYLNGIVTSKSGGVSQSQTGTIALDSVALPGVTYLNLRQLDIPMLKLIASDEYAKIAPYIGVWIKFDFNEIKAFLKEQAGPESAAAIDDYAAQVNLTQRTLDNSAMKLKIQQLFVSSHVLRVTAKTSVQTPEGVPTARYVFVLDKAGLRRFVIAVSQFMGSPIDKSALRSFDTQVIQSNLPTGEIWLGTADNLPYKIIINDTTTQPATKYSPKSVYSGSVSAVFKNYNQPLIFTAPSPFQNIIDILRPYFAAQKQEMEGYQAQSIMSPIRVSAEMYYELHNTSYAGLCQDQEGFLGASARASSQLSLSLSCYVSPDSQKYIVYTQLKNGKIACEDSEGFNGQITSLPIGKTTCQ